MDARANRCGLLADRDTDDPVPLAAAQSVAEAEGRRERRARKGTWEWYSQRHAPCVCAGCIDAKTCTVKGLWRSTGRPRQTRWHVLTTCRAGEGGDRALSGWREKAASWLSEKLDAFGTPQAHWALAALSGAEGELDGNQKAGALRFMLGLPDTPKPVRFDLTAEAARVLALGYGRGFLKWIAEILREAGRGAAAARAGPKVQVNAVRTTVIVYNTRKHGTDAEVTKCLERPAPRTKWMASRGLRAAWEGGVMVRKVFRALRLWTAMAGPVGLRRHRDERDARPRGAVGQEESKDGAEAFDEWASWRAWAKGFRAWVECVRRPEEMGAAGGAAAGALEGAEVRARRRLVWLRHAGFNPELARAKAAAAEQAAAAKAAAKAAAVAAKRAAEEVRRAAKVAARRAAAQARQATALARAAIAQALAEDAAVRSGAGSLAGGRGQRRGAGARCWHGTRAWP